MWPGPRLLANEVGERQPKSLPLGLYCLYRGVVIGGYSSSIKRLLPQPLRRVRHSLPPLPPTLLLLFLPHPSDLFEGKKKKWLIRFGRHSFIVSFLIFSSLCLFPRLCSACPLPARYRVCACRCVCSCSCIPAGCWFSCPPCRFAQWFCGCWLYRCIVHGLMLLVHWSKNVRWCCIGV